MEYKKIYGKFNKVIEEVEKETLKDLYDFAILCGEENVAIYIKKYCELSNIDIGVQG